MEISKRQRRLAAQKALSSMSAKFEPIDLTEKKHPKWMTRAFKNNRYVVMVNDNAITSHGKAIRVMVQKHTDLPIINHWREMQNIKNEIFGKECVSVEYYPSESELMDDHNIYWMWIYPSGVLPIPVMPKN